MREEGCSHGLGRWLTVSLCTSWFCFHWVYYLFSEWYWEKLHIEYQACCTIDTLIIWVCSDKSYLNPIKQTTKAHLKHVSINSSVLSDITLPHLLFLHQFAKLFLPTFSLRVLPTGDVWRRVAITMLKGMKLRLLEISLEPWRGKEEVAEFRLKNQATHFLVRCCLYHSAFPVK